MWGYFASFFRPSLDVITSQLENDEKFENEIESWLKKHKKSDQSINPTESTKSTSIFLREKVSISWLHFDVDSTNHHKNTALLFALAWNRRNAAKRIIMCDSESESLNIADAWPTCRNTPLVLAAKAGATDVAGFVVDTLNRKMADEFKKRQSLAKKQNIFQYYAGKLYSFFCGKKPENYLDSSDYRGMTALHYACIQRNHVLIKILIASGASVKLKDSFGKTALDYYKMEISENNLAYRYGTQKGTNLLAKAADMDNSYNGTLTPEYNSLRWFLPHVIINNGWGASIPYPEAFSVCYVNGECKTYKKQSGDYNLEEILQHHLAVGEPIYDAGVYDAAVKCYCTNRPKFDENVSAFLDPSFQQSEQTRTNPLPK